MIEIACLEPNELQRQQIVDGLAKFFALSGLPDHVKPVAVPDEVVSDALNGPLLGLVHLGVAALLLVLGRGWGSDDRGVDNGPLAHQQAALLQHRPNLVEQRFRQVVPLQPMAEVQQRRRVRHRRHRQIDPGKAAQRLAVVPRIFQRLACPAKAGGQPIPLLQKIAPQHPLQPNRRPAALALRVERPQPIDQPRQSLPRGPSAHGLDPWGKPGAPPAPSRPRICRAASAFSSRRIPPAKNCPAAALLRPPADRKILPDPGAPSRGVFQRFPSGRKEQADTIR